MRSHYWKKKQANPYYVPIRRQSPVVQSSFCFIEILIFKQEQRADVSTSTMIYCTQCPQMGLTKKRAYCKERIDYSTCACDENSTTFKSFTLVYLSARYGKRFMSNLYVYVLVCVGIGLFFGTKNQFLNIICLV